jgi:hypothetical protein
MQTGDVGCIISSIVADFSYTADADTAIVISVRAVDGSIAGSDTLELPGL